ncbi:MAG: glycosyltransferase family 4 protein [Chitinophagaceae bacterium]|nr:glycosyltransferase family 4 protein [Chitinophagaceae bacterium]
MKIARVIVTDTPVPGKNTASWPKLITRLLEDNICHIDAVICPPSEDALTTHHKVYYCKQQPNRVLNKLKIQYRYRHYYRAIDDLLNEYDYLILCIVDSTRVKNEIELHLQRKELTSRVRMMFYFHGYSYFFTKPIWEKFIHGIHHFVFLTRVAYEYHLAHSFALPFSISVLHNPINKQLFKAPSALEKASLKKRLGWAAEKKHFVWLSHNRPKKGFDIVLNAWVTWMSSRSSQDVVLHVIGVTGPNTISSVDFVGLINNNEVPAYLQAADIGIFSSLVLEGFPLSLMEMMCCGCFMIASQAGGVKEFFKDGVHGIAIHYPNEVNEWMKAFDRALHQLPSWQITAPKIDFLDFETWSHEFELVFKQVESSFNISMLLDNG